MNHEILNVYVYVGSIPYKSRKSQLKLKMVHIYRMGFTLVLVWLYGNTYTYTYNTCLKYFCV